MTSKRNPRESSVAVALAEIEALERARAEFAGSKREAGELLRRQARDIDTLRERLEAERPRVWARVRRREARARLARARALADESARQELEHRERLARHTAELDAKRRYLAELESELQLERPGRRLLEWSLPVAAVGMVVFMAMGVLGEDETVARVGADADAVELAVASEPVEREAPSEAMMMEETDSSLKAELDPPTRVEAKAPPKAKEANDESSTSASDEERRARSEDKSSEAKSRKGKSSKGKSSKDKSSKGKSADKDDNDNSVGIKKRSDPLILDKLDGNPLR